MGELTLIYKGKHRADCIAVKNVDDGNWDTPWYVTGKTVWADTVGRQRNDRYRGTSRWIVLGCNSVAGHECPAEVWVLEDSICRIAASDGRDDG